MASSNIKLFDENKGNMLSDSEFNSSTQRMNGLQAGVASSKLQNKAMYQASLVAYAIAQVMMQNGKNANDTDAVSAFVANLSGAMLQKVYDLATTSEAQAGTATGKWMSPALVKAVFDYRKATTAEAKAGTNDTKWMSPALVKAAIDKILSDKNFLQKSGGTMTGNLVLNANPTANLGAATKQYVDSFNNSLQSKIDGIDYAWQYSLASQVSENFGDERKISCSYTCSKKINVNIFNDKSDYDIISFTAPSDFNIAYIKNGQTVTHGGGGDGTSLYNKIKISLIADDVVLGTKTITVTDFFDVYRLTGVENLIGSFGAFIKKGQSVKIKREVDPSATLGSGNITSNGNKTISLAFRGYIVK